jgi:hypothetical protein
MSFGASMPVRGAMAGAGFDAQRQREHPAWWR